MDEQTKNEETKDETVEITVDGEVQKVTLEQLKADAQKFRSVHPKLQSEYDKLKGALDELKTDYQTSEEFIKDFRTVVGKENGDVNKAVTKIAGSLGMSKDEFTEFLAKQAGAAPLKSKGKGKSRKYTPPDDDDDEDDDDEEYNLSGKKPTRVGYDQLDPEIRRELEELKSRRLREAREFAYGQLDSAFDNNEKLRNLMKESPKVEKTLKGLARQALQRRVAYEGAKPGPRLYADVVDEVISVVDSLGIPKPGEDGPDWHALGLGPVAETLGEELHQERPPQRESVVSGDYGKNFKSRLAHLIRKAGGLKPAD